MALRHGFRVWPIEGAWASGLRRCYLTTAPVATCFIAETFCAKLSVLDPGMANLRHPCGIPLPVREKKCEGLVDALIVLPGGTR